MSNIYKILWAAAAIFGLSACSVSPQFGAVVTEALSTESYEIQVSLNVSTKLNPDRDGRPSPMVLRILQLENDSEFKQLNSESLLEENESSLGQALIKADQSMAFPGESQKYRLKVKSDTKFLGVVAGFQKEGGISKRLINIEGKWSRDLCIELSETSIASAKRC